MVTAEMCPLIKEDCVRDKCALFDGERCAISAIAVELRTIRDQLLLQQQ